ncbi:hypothetical protein LSTR_LSTR010133 [Laodelphax striatellus]|uniref:Uncharacterized protein n=1 Tax=Laodelphax striatellus TaxID=195883 RepID=A0A482WIX5_LAOST|nr:hypothetical protein LSTR_LSTR010133 [Laodelphax striatellus]
MTHIANLRVYLFIIKTFCSLAITGEVVGAYEVPPAIVEPLRPVGFRVSIPDHPGITLFAFHGNFNKDFENGHEAGEVAVDVLRKKNGFWTYTNRSKKLKEGDIIYYWLYVIKDGLGYERLFQSYLVDGFIDEGPGTPSKPTTTTTTTTRRPTTKPTIRPTQAPPPLQPVTDDIDIRNPGPGECKETVTTVNGEKACSGYLIFDSDFSRLEKNWTREVHFNRDESEFVVFDNSPTNSYVESDQLTIKPTLLDDYYEQNFTERGQLDLTNRCTSQNWALCKKERIGFTILPPVMSARLNTKDKFSFKYGIVEIRAKLPRGNWVVPEIWLMPKAHKPYGASNSGKIVLAKSIGNTLLEYQGIPIGNNLLSAGLEVNKNTKIYKKITNSGLWSESFHTFKLEWTPSGMIFYVDGEDYGKWDGEKEPLIKGYGRVSPFDQEFYLLLGIHVGGYHDVPNDAVSGGRKKPWSNTDPKYLIYFFEDLKNWHATWNDQTKLKVDYIRVYAL